MAITKIADISFSHFVLISTHRKSLLTGIHGFALVTRVAICPDAYGKEPRFQQQRHSVAGSQERDCNHECALQFLFFGRGTAARTRDCSRAITSARCSSSSSAGDMVLWAGVV